MYVFSLSTNSGPVGAFNLKHLKREEGLHYTLIFGFILSHTGD